MFDVETARLIRQAPPLQGIDPDTLPQQLTEIYAELTALRLRGEDLAAQPDRSRVFEQLRRMATIYEAAVDAGAEGEARRASAFVAATAHQLLTRVLESFYGRDIPFLGPSSISPFLSAPLLFLISEQNADAREAARPLAGRGGEELIQAALVESIYDLAMERFDEILQRAVRLQRVRASAESDPETAIEQALYGLCWSGIVQLAARLLNRDMPQISFVTSATAQETFDRVVGLASEEIVLPGVERPLLSIYSGPRHLARLLRHVADSLSETGIVYIPQPGGADNTFWSQWLRHRAKSKPVLWRNHRAALQTGLLEQGRSAVLVLPTGAGKTTVSELKIAATLARGHKVIFLVPTLALVDQLRDDLTESFPSSFADVEVSVDGDLMGLMIMPQLQSVEVMTPERCLALMSHKSDALAEVGLVVFDECHLLSPQGGGKRSLDAMLCLLQILNKAPQSDLLLLSAMLTNAEIFAAWVQEITKRSCDAFMDPWKPSRQARGVVVYERAAVAEIARAGIANLIQRRRGAQRLKRPPTLVIPYGLFGLHQNWNPAAPADFRIIQLSDPPVKLSLSTTTGRPTSTANDVAAHLAVQAVKADLKTIIFVQQAAYAPNTAEKIAKALPSVGDLTETEQQLWDSTVAEVGGEVFSLVRPRDAALPHNGDMLPLERRLVESLFRRASGANAIVATPTLAQGMNLPAQLAIIAGDKRHDASGGTPLEAHEILNAAGRAGRAGHLANGVVVMIPDPIAAFEDINHPEYGAFGKLATLLPPNDQCVILNDPMTGVLDRIQLGLLGESDVRYFVSRLRPLEDSDEARDLSLNVIRSSFAGFQARRAGTEADFNQKLAAVKAILAAERPANAEIAVIAAASGFSDEPLVAIEAKLERDINTIPGSIVGWSDWLIEFFKESPESYVQLMGADAGTALYVMRGKKTGGDPTNAEFEKLKDGLRAWLSGKPLCDIERALGADEEKIKQCPRARDLILKLASRNFYLILAAVAQATAVILARKELVLIEPSILEVLPVAFRKGYDTVDKVAFAQSRAQLRSRVLIHQAFGREIGLPMELGGRGFADIVDLVRTRLAFGGARQ